jgi:hypothetical protein
MKTTPFLALSAALLLSTACKKKDEAGAGAAPSVTAKGGATPGGETGRALSYLPADSQVLVGVNFAKLMSSAMWKIAEPMMMAQMPPELDGAVKTACISNLFAKLKTVQFAAKGADADSFTAVIGGIDQETLSGCLTAAAEQAKTRGKNITIKAEGDFLELTKEGDEDGPILIYFPDKTTSIIAKRGEKSASRSDLEAIGQGAGGIASSPEAMAMVNQAGAGEPVWFAMRGDAPWFKNAAEAGVKFKTLAGSLAFDGGLRGKVTLKMGSADEAKATAAMAQGQLDQVKKHPMLGSFLAKVTVEASGSDLKAGFTLDSAQLEQLAGMASMFQ